MPTKTIFIIIGMLSACLLHAQSWTADNGNGTYTNPLFYDEFSDPDIIRVGADFYMTGTTMHSVPGLPVLHSKDLVNWSLTSYALNRFDMGDEFDLVNGKEAYGQGIWAPCIRYYNGVFYIFTNVNRHGLLVFTASNPAGPWRKHQLGRPIYDMSVLFEHQRIYIVYGVDEIRMIELKPDLSGFVPNSDRLLIPRGNAMGEGNHFYKIKGKYYVTNADNGRLQCARASNIYGPYETAVVSAKETMGTSLGWITKEVSLHSPLPSPDDSLTIVKLNSQSFGSVPMHQGGIVDLPNGDWWGFSMMDFRSVGRTTFLSPVTWKDGWPFFGIEGNLGRSPRTWFKPKTGARDTPHAAYVRNDEFNSGSLSSAWQWNHNPVDSKYQLKAGSLELHTMPAIDFLWARNTLTQRGIGPESAAEVELNGENLRDGDIAGLGLMNIPYAWVGILREEDRYILRMFDQYKHQTVDSILPSPHVHLRAFGNFDDDIARLSYSTDGHHFTDIGDSIRLPYQLKTFQGTRYALFAYNTKGREGGYAAFSHFTIKEPLALRSKNVPINKTVSLVNAADRRYAWANPHGMLCPGGSSPGNDNDAAYSFRVLDRGNGKVALQAVNGTGFLTVNGLGLSADVRLMKNETPNSLFIWQDMLRGQCMLLSLKTHRYVGLDPHTGELYAADWPGTLPGRKDGTVFNWHEVDAKPAHSLTSPDENIKLVVEKTHFSVYYKAQGQYAPVMTGCELGISTGNEQFRNITLKSAGPAKSIHTRYEMITGRRHICSNAANETTFTFLNPDGKELNIIFRIYNDGVAFRYRLPKWSGDTINIKDEYTTYHIPPQTVRWMQAYDPSYEDFYPYSTTGKGEKGQQWAYPALFKANDIPVWYLISEAGNSEFNCAARLTNKEDLNSYKVTYPEPRKNFQQQGAKATLPWQSQWHTLIMGSLATVVGSTLITDVSDPSRIGNPDWIVPGAVSWIYWANNHGSKDYKKVVEYVDLAKNMGWPYVLIDWEWDAMTNGGNVEDAVKYARSKGIRPLLWYNSGTTEWAGATPFDRIRTRDKRIQEFQWLNSIGVYGIKVDFFAGDQQDMMKLYLDILEDAARYHLMVDFHGATIPRGWSRTYPNLMTVEAVYGAEWYNNRDILTNKAAVHNTTLPFTRNVIGSMDYTPVTFSNSQHPHITSYGHELALSVVFESALQHLADRPEAYYELPDAPGSFLKTVPSAWDETRLLNGFPGEHVVIARRRGVKWYIGGLNGLDSAKTLQFDLDFIKKQNPKITIIQDGDNDRSFHTTVRRLGKDRNIRIDCLPRGGFVCVIEQ